MARDAKRPRMQSDTVVFNVGGRLFEVFRHVITGRPSTLLAQMLDDISLLDDSSPIFVDANPDRFVHILDWYRYGEMYLPQECPVGAILRDVCYFLLPDTVRINGEMYTVRSPSAQTVRNATRTAILAEWPTFETFMRNTISDLTSHLEMLGRQSKESTGQAEFWSQGGDPTHLYKDFPIANYRADKQQWVWLDEENLCSKLRLCMLLSELRMLGFDCSVEAPKPHDQSYPYAQPAHKWDGAVAKMRIGVHLELNPRSTGPSRVVVDGVHVSHGRLWVSR